MKDAVRMETRVRGGNKIAARIAVLYSYRGVGVLRVGYFDSERAKYEDGTSVATVAALHEFGLASGSVRPKSFMAKAFPSMLKIVHAEIRLGKATHESGVSIELARRMGERAAQALNESVITHELVDTGLLSRSATYTIDDPPLTSAERPTAALPSFLQVPAARYDALARTAQAAIPAEFFNAINVLE